MVCLTLSVFNMKYLLLIFALMLASCSSNKAEVRDDWSALHYALFTNNVDLITLQELLELGADPNFEGVNGWTALHFAAQRGSLEAVCLLLNY